MTAFEITTFIVVCVMFVGTLIVMQFETYED